MALFIFMFCGIISLNDVLNIIFLNRLILILIYGLITQGIPSSFRGAS
jgi:hypothetical protein